MYSEDRTQIYIDSLSVSPSPYLECLRNKAQSGNVPVIRRQSEPLISFFLAGLKPARILEIGTAVGYSALFIWEASKGTVSIDTIERNPQWAAKARKNVAAYPVDDGDRPLSPDGDRPLSPDGDRPRSPGDRPRSSHGDRPLPDDGDRPLSDPGDRPRINVMEGDAADILPTLKPYYDMVFMDAAKGQYLSFLPHVERLLRPGGLLISDNILQDGDVINPRSMIHRRDRTIHKRMREYLYTITHSPKWQTMVLPIADGVSVSYRL